MDKQQIKGLQYKICLHEKLEKEEYQYVKEVLERDIAKPLEIRDPRIPYTAPCEYYICPNLRCHFILSPADDKENFLMGVPHCPKCGQKLKWER